MSLSGRLLAPPRRSKVSKINSPNLIRKLQAQKWVSHYYIIFDKLIVLFLANDRQSATGAIG